MDSDHLLKQAPGELVPHITNEWLGALGFCLSFDHTSSGRPTGCTLCLENLSHGLHMTDACISSCCQVKVHLRVTGHLF